MPLYIFGCDQGHHAERVRPMGTETIDCPVCSKPARRSVLHTFHVVGPTVDTRGMFRRYQEASQEIDHSYSKIEESVGHPVQSPNYYKMGRRKAAALEAAGESFKAGA